MTTVKTKLSSRTKVLTSLAVVGVVALFVVTGVRMGARPDLVLSNFTFTFQGDGSIAYTVRFQNRGRATASPFSNRVNYLVDGIPLASHATFPGPQLAPGATGTESSQLSAELANVVDALGIILDSNRDVAESNEYNNVAKRDIVLPDLQVSSLSISGTTVSVTVANQSSSGAAGFVVSLRDLNRYLVQEQTVDLINANESLSLQFVQAANYGAFEAQVDHTLLVKEQNEMNNARTKAFIAAALPQRQCVVKDPLPCDDGNPETIDACNSWGRCVNFTPEFGSWAFIWDGPPEITTGFIGSPLFFKVQLHFHPVIVQEFPNKTTFLNISRPGTDFSAAVELKDDGLDGDERAQDNIWTGSFTPTEAGPYRAQVSVDLGAPTPLTMEYVKRFSEGRLSGAITPFRFTILDAAASPTTCEELIAGHNSLSESRIKLILVGDNFPSVETWRSVAQSLINGSFGFLDVEPFRSNADKFNFVLSNNFSAISTDEDLMQRASACDIDSRTVIAQIHYGAGPPGVAGVASERRLTVFWQVPAVMVNSNRVSFIHEMIHAMTALEHDAPLYVSTESSFSGSAHDMPANCFPAADRNECLQMVQERFGNSEGDGCGQDGVADCIAGTFDFLGQPYPRYASGEGCWPALNPHCGQKNAGAEVYCWRGCGNHSNWWRATWGSIMAGTSTSHTDDFFFGPINERIICMRIYEETGRSCY